MSTKTTPASILASIEAIQETPENYRALREAVHGLKGLIEEAAK